MPINVPEPEFASLAAFEPSATLQRVGQAWRRDPIAASKAASLNLVLGNIPEALALSRLALRQPHKVDVHSRVRALIVLGTAGVRAHLDDQYRDGFLEAHGLLRGRDELETDLGVVLLINWAAAQSTSFQHDAALATMSRATDVIARLPSSWPLRTHRLNTIELNRFALTSWRSTPALDAYAEMAARFEKGGTWGLAAQCHLLYATQLRQADLYTAAVHHASRAEHAAVAADVPQLLFRARAEAARVFRNLGMTDQARAILEPRPDVSGSAAAADAGRLEMERSFEAERAADLGASFEHLDSAWHHFRPIILAAPGMAVHDLPVEELLLNALLSARATDNAAQTHRWSQRTKAVIQAIGQLPLGSPHALMLQTMLAFVAGDRIVAAAKAVELKRVAKDLALDSPRIVTPHDLEELSKQLDGLSRAVPNRRANVAEYLKHLAHVTAEDDETVRAAYRRANVLPVLNRMLVRGDLTPWGQFEAIELSRWGSLSGAIGAWTDSPSARSQLRERFLKDAAARDAHYPASLGQAHTVRWAEKWPGGIAQGRSNAADGLSGLKPIDLGDMIRKSDWCEAPDVLQIYRLGSDLVWTLISSVNGTITTGRLHLDAPQRALFAAGATWSSPAVTPLDHHLLATIDLPSQHLPTVAAIRCCAGPFVDSAVHAQDFALRLPASSRNPLANALEVLDRPRMDAIGHAIGSVFPAAVATATDRPLLLAIAPNLSGVPWGLATDPAGRLIVTQRPVAMLPPVNTIAAISGRRPMSRVPEWELRRLGSSSGNLSYTGERTSAPVDALIGPSASTNDRGTAVLYVGHLQAETTIPSESSMAVAYAGRDVLTAAELMRMPGTIGERVALMCCRGAGVHFASEWGGFASAMMLKGASAIIAPSWPIIDSPEAAIVDDLVASLIVRTGHIERHLRELMAELSADARVPAHWWAGMALIKGC